MSEEENKAEQANTESAPVEQQTEFETTASQEASQQGITLDDLKCGYVVGLTQDDNFLFEIVGKEKNLVSVLGVHRHATGKVTTLYDRTQMAGDALTHEVGKALQVLNQKIETIAAAVLPPKKPDNEL